jgi:Mlc titration factor MtfA (ptsG expression regulator)
MPGDTLIITHTGDTTRLPGILLHEQARPVHALYEGGPGELSDNTVFWFGLVAVLLIVAGRFALLRLLKRRQHRKLQEEALAELDSHHVQYNDVLANYNSYYRSLSVPLRNRFMQRVVEFIETKKFEYIDIPPDEKMPLLISGAAIQLTFGLEKYLLEYFDTIHVLRHDYHYGIYSVPFMGHVSSSGIYLSWDNFLRGYAIDTDADNVGVHEMAHALTYVNFMADSTDDTDDEFKKGFKEFSKVARPIFNDMQSGASNLLGDYAGTNYNEFWAVSVEHFFEKPKQLKEELPELYTALCQLLNQDSLLPDKGIYPS